MHNNKPPALQMETLGVGSFDIITSHDLGRVLFGVQPVLFGLTPDQADQFAEELRQRARALRERVAAN